MDENEKAKVAEQAWNNAWAMRQKAVKDIVGCLKGEIDAKDTKESLGMYFKAAVEALVIQEGRDLDGLDKGNMEVEK